MQIFKSLNRSFAFISVSLFLAFGASLSAQQVVDYRYAPQWWQSSICFPDDSCKTLVGPLGQLLYNYGGGDFFNYVGGFGTTVHVLADENIKITGQKLYSAKVPLVITESKLAGLSATQEIFAAGRAYTEKDRKASREDIILTTIVNQSKETKTINPLLIIDSKKKVAAKGRVAVVDGKMQLVCGLDIVRVRQNIGPSKTIAELEPMTIAQGETKSFAVLCDNGLPSDLTASFKTEVTATDFDNLKKETIDYWERRTDIPYNLITVPDAEIQNLVDASLRGIWQAREIKKGRIAFQVGPTCYRGLWLSDGAFILETAAMFDRGREARDGVEYTLSFQHDNGRFTLLAQDYWKEHGLVLWTCVRHAMLTQDKTWLRSVWPKLLKTVDFMKELRAESYKDSIKLDDGLMPPGAIDGGLWGGKDVAEYTNTLWNLSGLKAMVQAAEWLGDKHAFKALSAEYNDFYALFQKAAHRDLRPDDFGNRYLPMVMDPKHQSLPQRADWAFCNSVYPGQIFAQGDVIASGTMNMLHQTLQEGMVMGTGWDIDGIWTYFAGFYGAACLWMGDGERANRSLYAFANHASPLYNWREEQSTRDMTPSKYVGDMPHNWASALFAELAVHLLALDRGNELHLLEGIPHEWLGAGMTTALKDISTPFGKITFTLKLAADGKTATLTTDKLSDESCTGLIVHLGKWGEVDGKNIVKLNPKKVNKIVIRSTGFGHSSLTNR